MNGNDTTEGEASPQNFDDYKYQSMKMMMMLMPLCKGKGRKMTYKKLILADLPDIELQEVLTAARNREEWKNVTKLE